MYLGKSYLNCRKSKTEKILKEARGNNLTYRGARIRITFNFSETMQTRAWSEIFKVLRKIKHQPRNLYPENLSFESEGEIKTFSDKQKFGNLMRVDLQEMFKALQRKGKWYRSETQIYINKGRVSGNE